MPAFAESGRGGKNFAVLSPQLRNFATVGLCDVKNQQLNPLISLGMTLAVCRRVWKGEFS